MNLGESEKSGGGVNQCRFSTSPLLISFGYRSSCCQVHLVFAPPLFILFFSSTHFQLFFIGLLVSPFTFDFFLAILLLSWC